MSSKQNISFVWNRDWKKISIRQRIVPFARLIFAECLNAYLAYQERQGVIKRMYQELSLESLRNRRCCRKLYLLYKLLVFKSNILRFMRPSLNSVLNCHKPWGTCLITRPRLDLSHLRAHKFKHGFKDTLNPLFSCGNYIRVYRAISPQQSPQFANERRTLLITLGIFNYSLLQNTSNVLTQTLIFGNTSLSSSDNSKILLELQMVLSHQLKDWWAAFLNNESCIYWPQTSN